MTGSRFNLAEDLGGGRLAVPYEVAATELDRRQRASFVRRLGWVFLQAAAIGAAVAAACTAYVVLFGAGHG